MLHPVQLIGQFRILGFVVLDASEPGVAEHFPASADPLAEELRDSVGNMELGVLRPAVISLSQPDFLFAERLSVGGRSVLLVGGPVCDVTVYNNQSGTI